MNENILTFTGKSNHVDVTVFVRDYKGVPEDDVLRACEDAMSQVSAYFCKNDKPVLFMYGIHNEEQ